MNQRPEKTILFLCTGNYYRSRFAEIFFNSVAAERDLRWRATSRGLALERGIGNIGPMAMEAIEALKAMGVSAFEDCSRSPLQVTPVDLEKADHIVALKRAEHLPLLEERFPAWAQKVEFWHIEDTPGVLGLIEHEVTALVTRMSAGLG